MPNLFKSVAAGALGGLAASYVMNQFQALVSAASTPNSTGKNSSEQSDDATVKTARAISESLFDHELTAAEKLWAGPAVHYGFGTMLGALYGACADRFPGIAAGGGTLYGTVVWLVADEVGVPAVGLSGPPSETPLSGHANALASHLVFGVVTASVRRILLQKS